MIKYSIIIIYNINFHLSQVCSFYLNILIKNVLLEINQKLGGHTTRGEKERDDCLVNNKKEGGGGGGRQRKGEREK